MMEESSTEMAHLDQKVRDWLVAKVDAEPYWFQTIELWEGFKTPGWSNPRVEKLPYYGLPDRLDGLRVLDVGCAEGFFSFEAERRGAREVVSIDSFPDSVRRFNICRDALGSNATAYLCNVYDLSPRTFGTFDLVLFYGVLYHLRHPILALEKILSVCTGSIRFQTAIHEEPGLSHQPMSRFDPHGIDSGPDEEGKPLRDPTVFWRPNRACVKALADHVGFQNIETVCENDFVSIVVKADSPVIHPGKAPDQEKAPWS